MIYIEKKWLVLIPILGVYFIGMFIDMMAIDAAQYSAMAMEMLHTGNYLELYYRGQDYIDKPPLIFWTAAISFKFWGISNFAYKLPSVLFTLLGLYATYKLSTILYNKRTGLYAVLTLSSCYAWFLSNHDVRTDTILTACTILAIWQLVEFTRSNRVIHIIYAAVAIAGAMLTKGPIGLMVPALALGTDFVLKNNWKMFFRWQWLLLIFLIGLLLLPMLYGLYIQFDQSQGKQTYNGLITSGLHFYFWTQSFGRITGESSWKDDTDPFFFLHTFLWAFFPWCVLFVIAFIKRLSSLLKQKLRLDGNQEAITIGGIVFPAIAFSLSHYKLPHYIFVIFPLVAILTANFLNNMLDEGKYLKQFKVLVTTQNVIACLTFIPIIWLSAICFPDVPFPVVIVGLFGIFLVIYLMLFKGSGFQKLILPSLIAITVSNFILNAHIYPKLLTYQAESVASKFVKSYPEPYPFVGYQIQSYSIDFYYHNTVPNIDSLSQLKKSFQGRAMWILTDGDGYHELQSSDIKFLYEKQLEDYHVSKLSLKFLNPKTRSNVISHKYLLLARQ